MPITADLLLASLAVKSEASTTAAPQAIVVLSADMRQSSNGLETEPGPLSLDRLRVGAALQRRTELPILVSGGFEPNSPISLGGIMAQSLVADFNVPVRWVEGAADDTWENAKFSAAILRPQGITRVYLVTHGWHMRRAAYAFRHFDMEVTAAPVWQDDWPRWTPAGFVPDAQAWLNSFYGVHEWIGLAFYALRK